MPTEEQEHRIAVRELVCAAGQDVFLLPGGAWPCGARYISSANAARMLGVSRITMHRHMASGGVPLDPWRWVSLDWVQAILRMRKEAER